LIFFFRCLKYKNSRKLSIELLDTETQESEEENEEIEVEKYSEYLEKFIKDEATRGNEIADDIKDYLLQNPVFLTRNAHYLKHKLPNIELKSNDNSIIPFHYKILRKQPFYHYRKNSLKNARKVICCFVLLHNLICIN
jgi:flagellar biosynthesis regulator FlaF